MSDQERIYQEELTRHKAILDEESERETKANNKRKSKEFIKNVRLGHTCF
jgi:hypothetical protein